MNYKNLILGISLVIFALIYNLQTVYAIQPESNPAGTANNTMFFPFTSHSNPEPVRAIRVQYNNYQTSRAEVPSMVSHLAKAHVNMVGLAAGRVEWAYFNWPAHPEYTSNDVKDSKVDFLAADSAIYKQFGHINAVIDVLSPNYIKAHPETGAINIFGQRSDILVGTMELVDGAYGRLLLEMVDFIATNYPQVDSISLTELIYHLDGYGPQEKASYLTTTGRADWPHQANGQIDINDLSIGNWRSHLIDVYLDKLVAIAHAHGKQFFLDVSLSKDDLSRAANEYGTRYDLMLEHIDKLVVWGYYYLENYPPEFLQTAAQFLVRYGTSRVIMSIGMWGPTNVPMSPDLFLRGLQASAKGGLPNIWITPTILMNDSLWAVLDNYW